MVNQRIAQNSLVVLSKARPRVWNEEDIKHLDRMEVPESLDCVNNWGSAPFRKAVGVPRPVLACPEPADGFMVANGAKIVMLTGGGSHAVNSGVQVGLGMTEGRTEATVGVCTW